MLRAGPEIGAWATISLRRDDTLVQVHRGGHPSINPIINPDDAKNHHNTGEPATDVGKYLPLRTKILQASGGYTPEEAATAARTMLPDILRYTAHRGRPTAAGRALTHDVFSDRMAFLTTRMAFLTRRKSQLGRPQAARRPHGRLPLLLGPPNP